jgi:hypothetical protein
MFDVHQVIHDQDGDIDEGREQAYIDGLMQEFASSEEAKPVIESQGNVGYAAWLMEYAFGYIGVSPPQMSKRDFDEVVFELFPRKVSTPPESAPEIITELKAFWSFLRRHYGLKNADTILESLTDDSVLRLRNELANPRKYGMAKSFVMAGMKAGFDMATKEGLAAFRQVYNSTLRPPLAGPGLAPFDDVEDGPLPLVNPLTPKQRAEKRKARKSQRQARKQNRRK